MTEKSLECSRLAVDVGEPLEGSATAAQLWLAIEQLGPYGRDALIDSHFPREIGEALLARLRPLEIRPVLIRTTGHHPDDHHGHPRRIWLARSTPGMVQLVHTVIDKPEKLLDFKYELASTANLTKVAAGFKVDEEPLLLICSHAKHDQCCARYGRLVALELGEDPTFEGRVWETSHLGGHRFAPTAVQLPHGWMHGRLDAVGASEVLHAARQGSLVMASARGRSSLIPAAQVADLAMRAQSGILGLDDTRVEPAELANTWRVTADSADYLIEVSAEPARPRPASCGKTPEPWNLYTSKVLN